MKQTKTTRSETMKAIWASKRAKKEAIALGETNLDSVTPEFKPELEARIEEVKADVAEPVSVEPAVKPLDLGPVSFMPTVVDEMTVELPEQVPAEALTAVAADPVNPTPAEVDANLGVKATKAPKAIKKTKAPKALGDCYCGCGQTTKSKFAAGHDTRLKSLLLQVARGKADPSTIPQVAIERQHEIGFVRPGTEYAQAFSMVGQPLAGQPTK